MQQHAASGGVNIGGDFRGELIINQLAPAEERLTQLTPLRRERFASLLARHQLFAGRHSVLERLDDLANAPGGDYLLVTGRSGYGKTALLANWVTRRRNAGAAPCYSFISRVEGTEDEQFTLASLCEQLLLVHGRHAPAEPPRDWRSFYIDLLGTAPPDGRQAIVVLDGLDEARDWVAPDLFPPLAPGVSVVVSAREVANRDWASFLGLPAKTETIALDRLTDEEISELLQQAGPSAASVLADPEARRAVMEVSLGDPYYVRLLVDDIRTGGQAGADELRTRPRGLAAYFDSWWSDITASRREEGVRDVLGYLLVARGPLSRQELVDIDPDDTLDEWSVDKAIEAIGRHVVGNPDTGYVIGHDRFRQYLIGDRIGATARQAALDRLLEHCRAWRTHGSRYALALLPEHLREEEAGEELAALIAAPEWLAAHLAHDPSGASFLDGVRVAWRDAQARGWAGHDLTCALALSSVHSVLVGLPRELLRQLLVRRRWSEEAVLAAVRETPEPQAAAGALAHLAPDLSPQGARAALAIASALPDQSTKGLDTYAPRATALAALAPAVPGPARQQTIDALFATRPHAVQNRWTQAIYKAPGLPEVLSAERLAEMLAAVGPGTDPERVVAVALCLHQHIGDTALDTVFGLDDEDILSQVLAALAPRLGQAALERAVDRATHLPTVSETGSPRAAALRALAPALDAPLATRALVALAAVLAPGPRVWASVALAARVDGPELARTIAAARALEDPQFRALTLMEALSAIDDTPPDIVAATADAAIAAERSDLLDALTPLLDATTARRVLAVLEQDPSALRGDQALAVVKRLAPQEAPAVGRGIIAAARERDESRRSGLIAALTPVLPPDEALRVLTEELGHASVGQGLEEIARVAPLALWPALLDLATNAHPAARSGTFAALLDAAPPERHAAVVEQALKAAREIPARGSFGEPARGAALTALIDVVPEDRRDALVEEALAASQAIDDRSLVLDVECALLDAVDEDAALAILERLASLPAARPLAVAGGSRHPSIRHRAVEIAASITDLNSRLATLVELGGAAQAPFAATVTTVDDETLAQLARKAPAPLLESLLAAAEARPPSDPLAFLAATLLSRLEGAAEARALRWALRFPEEPTEERPSLRAWILDQAADALSPDVALQAVYAAQDIGDPPSSIPTMASLARSVGPQERPRLLTHMIGLVEIQPVAAAATALAMRVLPATEPGPQRDGLVRTVLDALDDDPARAAKDLAALAPYAEGALADSALRRALALPHPDARAYAGAHLATAEVVDALLRDARASSDEVLRCECLAHLAAAAPRHRRATLVDEALHEAWQHGELGVPLVREVLATAPLDDHEATAVLEPALRRALTIGSDEDQRTVPATGGDPLPGLRLAWSELLPRIPALVITEPSVVAIVDRDSLITVYRQRSEQLPASNMVAFIELALRTLRQRAPEDWADAVTELLPHLPAGRPALGQVAIALGGAIDRAVTYEALAPPLAVVLRAESGLHGDQKAASRFTRSLGVLAPRLAALHRDAGTLWHELLMVTAPQMRPDLLIDVRAAAPMLVALGGAQAALEGLERASSAWP